MSKTTVAHKHFEMGQAPYRLSGLWSMPSPGLAEANPFAYHEAMNGKPKVCCGQCDHCGTGIAHHYIITDAKGEDFAVGSSCIDKLGDVELISQATEVRRKKEMADRAKEREAKRLQREAKIKQAKDQEREKNDGLTDSELAQEMHQALDRKRFIARLDALEPIRHKIGASSSWGVSIMGAALDGQSMSGNVLKICAEILAKQHGRKNSKAYNEALPGTQELVNSVYEDLKSIEFRCEELERSLLMTIHETSPLTVSYSDIEAALDDEESALEF